MVIIGPQATIHISDCGLKGYSYFALGDEGEEGGADCIVIRVWQSCMQAAAHQASHQCHH